MSLFRAAVSGLGQLSVTRRNDRNGVYCDLFRNPPIPARLGRFRSDRAPPRPRRGLIRLCLVLCQPPVGLLALMGTHFPGYPRSIPGPLRQIDYYLGQRSIGGRRIEWLRRPQLPLRIIDFVHFR
jgi:hypothetical protein